MENIIIRSAKVDDAEKILDIYSWYVENTAITFEYTVPGVEEFRGRIAATLEKYPYIVAEREGEVLGYAYAGTFHARAAYDWSVETSIYVKRELRREGIGALLYKELEKRLGEQGILNLYACIASIEREDEYLTLDSVRFHEHLGYRLVGEFKKCGYKFSRWYDMVWMEKFIGEHKDIQPPVIWNENR